MNRKLSTFGLLLLACSAGSVHGQDAESLLLADPTPLSEAAAAPNARIAVLGSDDRIAADDVAAEIAAVEVTAADGSRERGVRVALRSEGQAALIYVNASQARQLLGELVRFSGANTADGCSGLCIHGIARCRPSQQVPQALCPAVYSATNGEAGVHLSTPRSSFRFPATSADAFAVALAAAIAAAAPYLVSGR